MCFGNVRFNGVAGGIGGIVGPNTEIGIAPSSKRFKDNIVTMDKSVSDRFLKLRPVSFFKDKSKKTQFGLIAEELYEIFPEMIALGSVDDFTPQVPDLEVYDPKLTRLIGDKTPDFSHFFGVEPLCIVLYFTPSGKRKK